MHGFSLLRVVVCWWKIYFCVMHFHIAHNRIDFGLVENVMCLSTSTLVVLIFPLSLYLIDFLCNLWINVHCHGCFQSRHVMTQLTLGPLALTYPKNMLVHISMLFLNVRWHPYTFRSFAFWYLKIFLLLSTWIYICDLWPFCHIQNHSANLKNEIRDDIKVSTTTREF